MQRSIATVSLSGTLPEKLEAIAAAGFDGVEIFENDLLYYDGLVNTTPMGMAKLPGTPVPAALLRAELWVAEIVYFPLETELLRDARALGCRTLDGGNMAVFQAVKAFELFSGEVADAQRMLAHFQSMNDSMSGLN